MNTKAEPQKSVHRQMQSWYRMMNSMNEELERRVELVRERDNAARGEAYIVANRWMQDEIDSDLLANVERGLHRTWYSQSETSGAHSESPVASTRKPPAASALFTRL